MLLDRAAKNEGVGIVATPIISRRILTCPDDSYRPPLPRLGHLLSQGAISGALGGLVIALARAVPMNGGRTLLVFALPIFMGWIAIHGLGAGSQSLKKDSGIT